MRQKDKYFDELKGLGYSDKDILDLDERGISIQTLQSIIDKSRSEVDDTNLDRAVYYGSLAKVTLLIKDPKEFLIFYYYRQRELYSNLEDWLDDLDIHLTIIGRSTHGLERTVNELELDLDTINLDPKSPDFAEEFEKSLPVFHAFREHYPILKSDFIEARDKVLRYAKECFDEDNDKHLANLNNIT
ncbi:hypothetical protein N9E26_01090 [bacterium]|nr:hypothetical protein [bacterium]